MGNVRLLSQPSTAQIVASDLEDAIRRGAMVPAHQISVRELAEENGLRSSALNDVLMPLCADGLLTVVGDTAIVTPLDPAEFHGICRVRRALERDLFTRSCELITPGTLDQLDSLVRRYAEGGPDVPSWGQLMREVGRQLARPASAHIELDLARQANLDASRYNALGWSLIEQPSTARPGLDHPLRGEHLNHLRELIDGFRTGRRRVVRQLTDRRNDDAECAAEASLVPRYTTPIPTRRPTPRPLLRLVT